MITALLLAFFHSFGVIVFFLGLQGIAFVPLTLVYEAWKRRALRILPPFKGLVTVIVPAYNEEKTIGGTVSTLLESDYPNLEIIVVNDGSTDSTEEVVAGFVRSGRIRYIKKENGGKASALNAGIEAAGGEVILFTDADSIFLPDTISKMVRWFGNPSIDAVCGNDAPLHPSTAIQKFLTITTHIGTGFVRRALSILKCLPIITGNLGAVRTSVLREIGGFADIWGEDLEITFRLYRNRKRIIFDPEPKVIAECPATVTGLWRQRLRWLRSYIKISLLHRGLFFNMRYAPFSLYLPVNFLNMTVVPLLQIGLIFLIPWAYATEHLYFMDTVEVLTFLGVIFFFTVAVYSIILDRDYKDLLFLPYGLLVLPFSYFYNAVALFSWWKELKGAEERWVKVERRKVFRTARPLWEYAVVALFLIVASSALTYYYTARIKAPATVGAFRLGLSTHFDAWGDWRRTVSNIMKRPGVAMAEVVGVSAGRPEWTYFRWRGRRADWSNHQKQARVDLLEWAASSFHRAGFTVAAFIDVFGPKYLSEHPESAAVSFDGKVHGEQVSFTELVGGDYGRKIIDMIEYIAANYDVDIIDITELPYYTYSYNPSDLGSYESFTGRKGWPVDENGNVDRDDPSIWRWRNALMRGFIRRAAGAAHRHGKKLYVDVPVSWSDFSREGREFGLDYSMVLESADAIVVWNYFFLEGKPPEVSESLARHLSARFPPYSFYISIGLWGENGRVMGPGYLDRSIASTIRGGVRRIWVTPDSLITDEHWQFVLRHLKE